MTITVRYIDDTAELDARWAEIWLLLDALDQFHADLLKMELRPSREGWVYERVFSGLQRGDYWFQVAEQGDEIVGIASASIHSKGRTHQGSVGVTGDMYLKESVRGQGLYPRMYEMRLETLRQRGLTISESGTYAANARALEIWRLKSWGCTLRKPLRDLDIVPPVPIRRIKNLDQDWAGIWRLLKGTEVEARTRAEAAPSKRGAVFVAGQEPTGVIISRISVNPGPFVERVGEVSDLEIKDGLNKELSQALLGHLEQWMISKQATEIQTPLLRHGEYEAWSDQGFQPHLFYFQERLPK